MSITSLKNAQRAWAERTGRAVDAAGYVDNLDSNLMIPLCEQSLSDFSRGSGGELKARRRNARAKLFATHSSAALACNAFEYWRIHGLNIIELALGLPASIESFQYEAQFPTGLEGEPPNLDVALRLSNRSIWAIESKFTEVFRQPKLPVSALKEKYFNKQQAIWTERGLPSCGKLATALRTGDIGFRRLDAVQLLKHALGLKASGLPFVLVYMWLDIETKAGDEHRADIDLFSKAVGVEIGFRAIPYQKFIAQLRIYASAQHDPFFAYFADRYGCKACQ